MPIKKGETLQKYYARAQRKASKTLTPQIVIAPKTVLGSKQPELEIKVLYPNPKGIKADVVRAVVGRDSFGNRIVIESVAPKGIINRIKFKIGEKIKFKIEAAKYLFGAKKKVA